MPTNPRSIILDDLEAVENYMYNLNGTHLLDLQPPLELDVVEQQKWLEKEITLSSKEKQYYGKQLWKNLPLCSRQHISDK